MRGCRLPLARWMSNSRFRSASTALFRVKAGRDGRFTPKRISRYAHRGHSAKRSSFERLIFSGSGEEGSKTLEMLLARYPFPAAMLFKGFEVGDDPRAGVEVHVHAVLPG